MLERILLFLDGIIVFSDKTGNYLRVIEDELARHNLALKAHLVGHEGIAKTLSLHKEPMSKRLLRLVFIVNSTIQVLFQHSNCY